MKWPLVTRRRYNSMVQVMNANLEVRGELIDALKRIIVLRDGEIKALNLVLEGKKCNDYTPQPTDKPKRLEPVLPSRSGWRTRAEMASVATIPAPKDSAKALEKKVQEEGGVI